MAEHLTELNIAGTLVDARIHYEYTPADPGCYTGPADNWRAPEKEGWEFTQLWVDGVGGFERCDLLLQFIDDDEIIDEIKAGWDD